MPSSLKDTSTLSVVPARPIGPRDLPRRIQITDGSLSLIAKGFGEVTNLPLDPGVYQARVESSDEPFEQMIFLAPGNALSIAYPLHDREVLDSPAPVPGSDAMHETMRDPLEQAIARNATDPKQSRFILMANHSGRGQPSIDLSAFRLLNAQGQEVGHLADEAITGTQNAFRLFSRDLDEGGLVLEGFAANFRPGERLRQPLWCSAGWCTLMFLGVDSKTGIPDLNTASIYLWRIGTSFAPESPQNKRPDEYQTTHVMQSQQYTELALRSLVDGRNLLSMGEVDTNLLVEKFSNPMLGILGCHLLFQEPAQDAKLVKTVISNLHRLLPNHPDVIALQVMSRQLLVTDPNGAPLPAAAWPPMLRQGFIAIRDQDWESAGSVQPDSLYDRTRTRVLNGGVWTRWIAEKQSEFASPVARYAPSSLIAWALPKLTKHIDAFARRLLSSGKRPQAADLRWSGLNQSQAQTALRLLSGGLVNTSRPAVKRAYAKKKVAKKAKKKLIGTHRPKARVRKRAAKKK